MVFDRIKESETKWQRPEKSELLVLVVIAVVMISYILFCMVLSADSQVQGFQNLDVFIFFLLLPSCFIGAFFFFYLIWREMKGMEIRGVHLYHNTAIERIERALQYHVVSFTKQSIHGQIPKGFLFRFTEIFEIPYGGINIKVLKGVTKYSGIHIGPVTDVNTGEIDKLKAIIDDGLKLEHQAKERPTGYVPSEYRGNQ